jgi:hypothetical protein
MKYQRNGTKEWKEEYVEEDDYKYVMNRVCTEETTGADKNRKKKLILAQIRKVEKERATRKKTQRKKRERNAMLAKVDLIFDKDVINGLKDQKLTDQIAACKGWVGDRLRVHSELQTRPLGGGLSK